MEDDQVAQTRSWRIRYLKRPTSPLIPFIQEGIRCTMISRQHIGVWNEERCCRVCCPLVTPVRKSKPSINDPLDCCNLCKYLTGSGKRLLWILLWDCLGLSLGNILVVWNEERYCRVCCPLVTPARKSRPSINDPLDCCNLCKYLTGNGKRLL
jgi:hypothetical protein